MALGIPARFKEDANSVELNLHNADNYVLRARRYRKNLRRLD